MSGLRLERLRVGYGERAVLGELDLDISDGEIRVVLGASGCGKSTLLRTIAGLQDPVAGQVLVGGTPVTGPGRDRVLIFQDDGLLPWRNVQRNVELPMVIRGVRRAERRSAAHYWLERVGLDDAAHQLPHQLSGGMRQRGQLARALAGEPGLLLMDEPFGALDAQTRAAMQRLLVEVWKADPRTIVFVTHDVDEALALGDRITILDPCGPAELINVPTPRDPQPGDPAYRRARARVLAVLARNTLGQHHLRGSDLVNSELG